MESGPTMSYSLGGPWRRCDYPQFSYLGVHSDNSSWKLVSRVQSKQVSRLSENVYRVRNQVTLLCLCSLFWGKIGMVMRCPGRCLQQTP